MIFQYFPDTDMLYIELCKGVGADAEEVAEGIVLDFDENRRIIGIEIEDAGKRADLSKLEISSLPAANFILNSNSAGAAVCAQAESPKA